MPAVHAVVSSISRGEVLQSMREQWLVHVWGLMATYYQSEHLTKAEATLTILDRGK